MATDNETKVRECIEVEHLFSEWELEFLESMQSRLKRTPSLTDKQQAKLDDLYQKACDSSY